MASREGPPAVVVALESRPERVTVYNFEVEGRHNYFVGHQPVLVHNMSWSGSWQHGLADEYGRWKREPAQEGELARYRAPGDELVVFRVENDKLVLESAEESDEALSRFLAAARYGQLPSLLRSVDGGEFVVRFVSASDTNIHQRLRLAHGEFLKWDLRPLSASENQMRFGRAFSPDGSQVRLVNGGWVDVPALPSDLSVTAANRYALVHAAASGWTPHDQANLVEAILRLGARGNPPLKVDRQVTASGATALRNASESIVLSASSGKPYLADSADLRDIQLGTPVAETDAVEVALGSLAGASPTEAYQWRLVEGEPVLVPRGGSGANGGSDVEDALVYQQESGEVVVVTSDGTLYAGVPVAEGSRIQLTRFDELLRKTPSARKDWRTELEQLKRRARGAGAAEWNGLIERLRRLGFDIRDTTLFGAPSEPLGQLLADADEAGVIFQLRAGTVELPVVRISPEALISAALGDEETLQALRQAIDAAATAARQRDNLFQELGTAMARWEPVSFRRPRPDTVEWRYDIDGQTVVWAKAVEVDGNTRVTLELGSGQTAELTVPRVGWDKHELYDEVEKGLKSRLDVLDRDGTPDQGLDAAAGVGSVGSLGLRRALSGTEPTDEYVLTLVDGKPLLVALEEAGADLDRLPVEVHAGDGRVVAIREDGVWYEGTLSADGTPTVMEVRGGDLHKARNPAKDWRVRAERLMERYVTGDLNVRQLAAELDEFGFVVRTDDRRVFLVSAPPESGLHHLIREAADHDIKTQLVHIADVGGSVFRVPQEDLLKAARGDQGALQRLRLKFDRALQGRLNELRKQARLVSPVLARRPDPVLQSLVEDTDVVLWEYRWGGDSELSVMAGASVNGDNTLVELSFVEDQLEFEMIVPGTSHSPERLQQAVAERLQSDIDRAEALQATLAGETPHQPFGFDAPQPGRPANDVPTRARNLPAQTLGGSVARDVLRQAHTREERLDTAARLAATQARIHNVLPARFANGNGEYQVFLVSKDDAVVVTASGDVVPATWGKGGVTFFDFDAGRMDLVWDLLRPVVLDDLKGQLLVLNFADRSDVLTRVVGDYSRNLISGRPFSGLGTVSVPSPRVNYVRGTDRSHIIVESTNGRPRRALVLTPDGRLFEGGVGPGRGLVQEGDRYRVTLGEMEPLDS